MRCCVFLFSLKRNGVLKEMHHKEASSIKNVAPHSSNRKLLLFLLRVVLANLDGDDW